MPKRVYTQAYACVRFVGDKLDPLDVMHALRLPHDHVHRRGEPRFTRNAKGKVREAAPHQHGMWSMSTKRWVESPVLDTHLRWLLNQLEPRREQVLRLIESGVTVDFFCYSRGRQPKPPDLPQTTRDRAAAIGIEINIDHYVDSGSTSERPASFDLWLEFEHWTREPSEDPTDDFCHIAVRLPDGRTYNLNVWTFRFLERARYPWPHHKNSGTPEEWLLPPDLLVERLDRQLIERTISQLIANDEMSPQWLDGPDNEAT